MTVEFPVEETIRKRYSVRTYIEKSLASEIKEKMEAYIRTLTNPFLIKIDIKLLEKNKVANAQKLGTYGMIKGASDFIGASVKPGELSLIALGYEFEKLILFATSLGLGTCWLGGTFNRGEFSKAMSVEKDDIFPVISPFGHIAEKARLSDSLVRFVAKSNTRKPWETLFFNNNFSTALIEQEAGAYALPLEMVRLAPSASNKQPWRLVREGNAYHFYKVQSAGYSNSLGFDIQLIDMGIAACHFNLMAIKQEIKGKFEILNTPMIETPDHTHYVFSWISE